MNFANFYYSLYLALASLAYHSFKYSTILLINWFSTYVYADFPISEAWILSPFLAVLYQFGMVAWNITLIWSWLRPRMIKNRWVRKRLTASLYLSREGWDFIYISDNGSPTICQRVSNGGNSTESDIKVIL